jgi:hypothetical protein
MPLATAGPHHHHQGDIAGFGLNWQHCGRQAFAGFTYSFEKIYQALRRSLRYGRVGPVQAHLIYAESEGNILSTLRAKQEAHQAMQQQMNAAMAAHGLFRDATNDGAPPRSAHCRWRCRPWLQTTMRYEVAR